ncbi:hypothetical protein FNF27_02952 [Cafeteria roenbergensis]|uniref:Uncharacterized protein n=1 Tax=Cafeteria roenbergensis TaxID=33653 RepID=A0A5A8EDE1_CAFRO|nr:hypothetical protein FNF27_02952 [Cafeteria roenbergensis]
MRCRAAALVARAARSGGTARPLCLGAVARRAFSEAREEPFVAVSTVQETSGRFRNEPRERWFWEWRGTFHEHNLKMFECETPAAVAAYYLENCASLHPINLVFAANRICVLDTDGACGPDMEPIFAGIDKWIHNYWQRLSPREMACILFIYARYRRKPRQFLLRKAIAHIEAATLRLTRADPRTPLFRPPPDDDRLRRTAFSAISGPSGADVGAELANAAWAMGTWRLSCPVTTARIALEAMQASGADVLSLDPSRKAGVAQGKKPTVLASLPPEAVVRLVWGLAACKQRHGGLGGEALAVLAPSMQALSFTQASLLLWAATYHHADGAEDLAALVMGSPLVQAGHDDPSALGDLPRGVRQQLVEARRLLVARLGPDSDEAAAVPALPDGMEADTVERVKEQRRAADPISRAYNAVGAALVAARVPARRGLTLGRLLGREAREAEQADALSRKATRLADGRPPKRAHRASPGSAGSVEPAAPVAGWGVRDARDSAGSADILEGRARPAAPAGGPASAAGVDAVDLPLAESGAQAAAAAAPAEPDEVEASEAALSVRVPLAVHDLKLLFHFVDTPLHGAAVPSVPETPRRRRNRIAEPLEAPRRGEAALAVGDWLSADAIRIARAAGWRIEELSYADYAMAEPEERGARLVELANRVAMQCRAAEARLQARARGGAALPEIL